MSEPTTLCRHCNCENASERRYCAQCGHRLPLVCQRCLFINEPAANFCGGCGNILSQTPADAGGPAAPGEKAAPASGGPDRRQLTVMFCDLVGSTALSAHLDPEDLRELIHAYRDVCSRAMMRYDGYISQYLGDGILAYFGYPRAHEDDAERATRAGLDIISRMPELKETAPDYKYFDPAVRIGIATGLVVAGDLVGVGAASQQAVVGKTPNLAARLQTLAQPNTLVIGESTRRLLRGLFEYEDLGAHELKGFNQKTEAYRVLRPNIDSPRFDAVYGTQLPPMIGREDELSLLVRRWEKAKQGNGQVVLLRGEAGIGKSRLCKALSDKLSRETHTRIRLQCSPYHSQSAFHPFISHLEHTAGLIPDEAPGAKLTKIERLLRQSTQTPQAALPLIATLLSVPMDDNDWTHNLTAQQMKERILASLVEQVEGLAARRPVYVEVEDAHWIDPTSLDLLQLVIARCRELRVLIVVTFRPQQRFPDPGLPHITGMALERLTPVQSQQIARAVAGRATIPEEVLSLIAGKTDGVPLYVEELTKTVLKATPDGDDCYVDPAYFNVPETLKDSLMARLDQLTPVKAVAQIGAVIGRDFSYELMAEVSGLAQDDLDESLKRLEQAELIFRSRRHNRQGADFVFKHALLQEAAYESLLMGRRRELHARIGRALERRFPQVVETQPEIIAHHYTAGGLTPQAIRFWGLAGKRALDQSANFEAVNHIENALRLLAGLPDSEEKTRQELRFQIILGAAYRTVRGFASREQQQAFLRARELCEQVGESAAVAQIDVTRGLYSYHYARGELHTARELAEQVIQLARRHDPDSLNVGLYMLGGMHFWLGEFEQAQRILEESWATYSPDRIRPDSLSAQSDPGAFALFQLTWTLWMLGYPDQAQRTASRVLELARSLKQPFTLSMTLFWTAATYTACGKIETAETLTEEMRRITSQHHLSYLEACARVLESHQLIARGHYAMGLEKARDAQNAFHAQGAGLGVPWALSAPITGCIRLGEHDAAMRMIDMAKTTMDRTDERQWEAEICRLEGELYLARDGATAQARQCLQRAGETASRQKAHALRLRASQSEARWLQASGRVADAVARLQPAYEWFEEGFDTTDLQQARETLDELRKSGRSATPNLRAI